MMEVFETELLSYGNIRRNFWKQIISTPSKSWGKYYRNRLKNVYCNSIPKNSDVLEIGCGRGDLLAELKPKIGVGIDFCLEMVEQARTLHPEIQFIHADAHHLNLQGRTFDYIVISELVNDVWDVQRILLEIQACCASHTRLIFNFYSQLWNIPLRIAQKLDIATPNLPQNWLTSHDMINLLEISGYQFLNKWEEIIVPLPIPYLANFINRYFAKIPPFSFFALANCMVGRSLKKSVPACPTVSVIVAARNEAGHIEELMARIPELGGRTEIIFVEGNSTDNTYEVIKNAIAAHPERDGKLLKQTGKGKGDAVRAGFDAAKGDILMILDADITVPPEDLIRFYDLLVSGSAEFVNGVRLVYPMEDGAMRFANLVGNKFFSWAFSWLLGQPIRDTLCGTKVLWRSDYERIAKNRAYFGDFDPFGDFDLLFGAAKLNLKIMEIPVRYRARKYGETNISRWRHGWLLLKMVWFAARRIKFV